MEKNRPDTRDQKEEIDEPNYGKETARQRRRERGARILKTLVFLTLIITVLLLKLPHVEQQTYTESIPVNISIVAVERRTSMVEDCKPRNFSWEYRWDGWNPEDANLISPRFWLINNENLSGYYEIQFAFMDDRIYKFENYANREITDLPFQTAAMVSERVRILLFANESRLIPIPTLKKDPAAIYWTYADVTPPTYPFCFARNVTNDTMVIRNVTKYVNHEETNCTVIWDYWWRPR